MKFYNQLYFQTCLVLMASWCMVQLNTQILKPTVQLFAHSSLVPMGLQQNSSMTGQLSAVMLNVVDMGSV